VEANQDLKPFEFDKIELIASNLKKIGAGVVLLTGGEPFLRKDIDVIVRIFKSKGLDIRMQTAGLIERKEIIEKCVQNGARDINVSIDSLDENLSDYINGIKGSWSKALTTISFISQTFPKKDSICALGCVLSKYNIDEIEPILDFATKIGWWLSLVPIHLTKPDNPMNFRGYDQYFKIPNTDFEKVQMLINKLKDKKRQGYNLFDSDDYLDSIVHFVKTGSPNWRHNGVCDSPDVYFVILPDGSFAPCCDYRFPEKIYVYDKDFPDIFKSKVFRQQVKRITMKCPGCNFGSFPEMTLSVRSFNTIFERVKLQFKAGKRSITPIDEAEIYKIINKIKGNYPIYNKSRVYQKRESKLEVNEISEF
jgi:MoaA/NifB/PqqE/SkfB family radical SAM enzyme